MCAWVGSGQLPGALQPRRIERVTGYQLGDLTECSANDARHGVDLDKGRAWVIKTVANNGSEIVLAEATSYLLARALRVQVPEVAVCMRDGAEAWLSRTVDKVSRWDPLALPTTRNLRHLGALLALDVLVFNRDRHAGNILLEPGFDGLWTLWGIDWSESHIGYPDDLGQRGMEMPSKQNLARGVPFDVARGRSITIARRAKRLSVDVLREVAEEAATVSKIPKADAILSVLRARCRCAVPLVRRYMEGPR